MTSSPDRNSGEGEEKIDLSKLIPLEQIAEACLLETKALKQCLKEDGTVEYLHDGTVYAGTYIIDGKFYYYIGDKIHGGYVTVSDSFLTSEGARTALVKGLREKGFIIYNSATSLLFNNWLKHRK